MFLFDKVKNGKIFTRSLSFVLLIVLVVNLFNISVYGADTFSDVKPSDYYYEAIQEMADKDYVKGYGDTTFRPRNNITKAESLTLLYRLAGYDIPTLEDSQFWYSGVWNEGLRMGLVYQNDDPNEYATRLDIAKFIIKIYQIDISLTNVENVFTDTNLLVANTMYQYGIFIGSPVEGGDGVEFLPYSHITRGDLSLVIYRINEKIRSPYIGKVTIGEYEIDVNPDSFEDFMYIMECLGESGNLSMTIPYSRDLSNISYYLKIRESAISAFEQSFSKYPELFSFTPTLSLKREIYDYNSGVIVLTLSNENISDEEVLRMRSEFDTTCEGIVNELYAYEVIVDSTPTIDKARLFYEYVALHCEYDLNYGVNSFTGYGAAIEGKAVCQGYTAMFNKLCRVANLDVIGISGYILETNEPHVWSAVYNEETSSWIYCDVTYGDPVVSIDGSKDYYDLSYFNIAEEELMIGRIKDWE